MTAQQLKNSILQMAVQGKLVPQDPNDEPASVLLERIRNEKEKLVKAGKIKQKKNPSVIFRGADNIPYEKIGNEVRDISDEIPFEIPDSWEWVRLGSLLSVISDGTHKTPTYVENGIPFLSVQNISKGFFDFNKIKYITKQEHDKLSERVSPKKDDILICRIGTLGKAIKCTLDFEFSIFVSLGLLRPVDPSIVDYIIFVINSPIGDKWIQNNKVGGGTHTYKINLIDIPNMLIPLPPLQEQTRISDKLQEIDPYLSEYEKDDNKLDRLSMSFPDQLKKSILQQAVKGKLVDQDPNDEPASVLLERIRAEKQRLVKEGKIKKDKHDSVIYRRDNSHYEKSDGIERCIDDEIPFEIPDSWEWVRLGMLFSHNTGKALNASNHSGKLLDYITTSNLYWDRFDLKKLRSMYFTDREIKKCTVVKGDLLVCEGGDIGRAAVWENEFNMRIQNHIHRLRPYVDIYIRFFYYLFYFYKHAGLIGGKGIGIQGLSSNTLHQILLPLPPIKEQQRIVTQIEKSFCPISFIQVYL